jgi:hypothetical protein
VGTKIISDTAMFYGDKGNVNEYGTLAYDNSIWLSVLNIPFIQRLEQSENFDVIIRTMWLESVGWSKAIRDRWPSKIQIGLNDHPLGSHISKMSAEKQAAYIDDLQYLDGIMALSEEEREWYSVVCPAIPVVNTGLPFPYASYEEHFAKFRDKEKKYIGLGVGASDNDRNFVSSVMAFQKLRLLNPELKGVFLSIPDQLVPQCAYWADRVDGIYIHKRTNMSDYLELLAQCKFVINLADRNTPGRLQGEAAFLGVPVIGSDRLELQRLLFPDLAVRPYELESVVKLGQLILDTPTEWEDVTSFAQKTLKENFDLEPSKAKFDSLMAQIIEGAK